MYRINDDILRDACRTAPDKLSPTAAHKLAYCDLGPWLARWLLRPGVLARVAEHDRARGNPELRRFWEERPRLPTGRGACWVVFAQQDYPLLRDGSVLPLEWRENEPHSRRLPAAPRELAEDVLHAASVKGFGLHGSASAGIDQCDLAGLGRLRCDSGWASLYGGLVIAAEGGLPDPKIWASGQWSAEKGVQPVEQLEAKLEAAWHWGCRRFFVPASQRAEAEAWVRSRGAAMLIGELAEGKPDGRYTPRDALREYLAEFGAEPDHHAPREARKLYYLRQTNDRRRLDYYRRCLLEDVAKNCRAQIERSEAFAAATHMITILSGSPELVELGVAIFRPARVLVLHTPETKTLLDEARRDIVEQHSRCEVVDQQFEVGDRMISDMRAAIEKFTAGTEPHEVVFDLVPGTKEMTLALAIELARPGTRLYYLRHVRQGPLVLPFKETPLLWVAGRVERRTT